MEGHTADVLVATSICKQSLAQAPSEGSLAGVCLLELDFQLLSAQRFRFSTWYFSMLCRGLF